MSRRPAKITQAEIERVIRAAKAQGAAELEIRVGPETVMIIRLQPSTGQETTLAHYRDFSL